MRCSIFYPISSDFNFKIEAELLGSMELIGSSVKEDAFVDDVGSERWELLDNYNCSKNVIIFVRCLGQPTFWLISWFFV
jgi:hypothetical protein